MAQLPYTTPSICLKRYDLRVSKVLWIVKGYHLGSKIQQATEGGTQ